MINKKVKRVLVITEDDETFVYDVNPDDEKFDASNVFEHGYIKRLSNYTNPPRRADQRMFDEVEIRMTMPKVPVPMETSA